MAVAKNIYERLTPLIVWLGLTELAWLGYWLLSAGDNSQAFVGTVFAWIVTMIAWLALVIFGGLQGFFLKHSDKLSNLVGVTIVVTFAVAIFSIVPAGWHGLVSAARNTSDLQLISIHILRLLAIGTFIKFLHGELPLHFVILGTMPDFLFAVSAVVLAVMADSAPIGTSFLIVWHLVGFTLFLGPGIAMFFSVPSPLRIYNNKPDASIVFQFPMVLAPNFTVPLFMIAHLLALTKLLVH
ncbi:hypothetical protein OAS39_06545 [Pirellulales bacterium]|nr:hypothetical protein [Pirellulales bacterium]